MTRHCVVGARTAQAWVRHKANRHHIGDSAPVSVVREHVLDLPPCPLFSAGRRFGRCGGWPVNATGGAARTKRACNHLDVAAQRIKAEPASRQFHSYGRSGANARPAHGAGLVNGPPTRDIVQPQVGLALHSHRWAAQIAFLTRRGGLVLAGWAYASGHRGATVADAYAAAAVRVIRVMAVHYRVTHHTSDAAPAPATNSSTAQTLSNSFPSSSMDATLCQS